MYVNEIMLIGRIVKAPEHRQLSELSAVTTLRIAVNSYRPKGKAYTLYIDCLVYGTAAMECIERFHTGDLVYVKGELEIPEWESNGDKKRKAQVRVFPGQVKFLASSSKKRPSAEVVGSDAGNVESLNAESGDNIRTHLPNETIVSADTSITESGKYRGKQRKAKQKNVVNRIHGRLCQKRRMELANKAFSNGYSE